MTTWILTIAIFVGAIMWVAGVILKSSPVSNELKEKNSGASNPYTRSDKMRLGLRILEAIYCVKGVVSWSRVFCIAIILNIFLYNLVNFAGLGMVILQQMIKQGVPADTLPKSLAETLALSLRTIDLTDITVMMSILLYFASAIAVDLLSVYMTLAFYRHALRRGSLWPIWLNLCLLGLFFYLVPYLYFDQKNKPFLAYLLAKDYLHFAFFGLPGAQIFLVQDSFVYREVIFSDQRAFQLLGLLGPLSAAIPISIVILSLPLSLVESARRKMRKLRQFALSLNPDILTGLGTAIVVVAGALAAIAAIPK